MQGPCAAFIQEADSEAFCKKLTEFEDWLYDEGEDETKSVQCMPVQRYTDIGSDIAGSAYKVFVKLFHSVLALNVAGIMSSLWYGS